MRFDKDGKRVRGKDIVTPFGKLDLGNKEEKEQYWGEVQQVEEARIRDAQRKYHARMSEKEREDAAKWVGHSRYLLDEE
ncbi:MAG: hypothetical protein M8319_05635 [Nitrosopumilus sp.]|nr:hypothetical protein [Nitrosopumilus sp.]